MASGDLPDPAFGLRSVDLISQALGRPPRGLDRIRPTGADGALPDRAASGNDPRIPGAPIRATDHPKDLDRRHHAGGRDGTLGLQPTEDGRGGRRSEVIALSPEEQLRRGRRGICAVRRVHRGPLSRDPGMDGATGPDTCAMHRLHR